MSIISADYNLSNGNNNEDCFRGIKIITVTDEKSYGMGDIINYTIIVKNKGDFIASDVCLSDGLTPQLQFINGSVIIDSVATPLQNIVTGIEFESIEPGECVKIEFKSLILKLPPNGKISTQSVLSFYSVSENCISSVKEVAYSNINTITVDIASLLIERYVNKSRVLLYESITYTIVIKNNGTVNANNIIVKEKLQEGLEYVSNSFTLNDTNISGIDSIEMFNVGTLKPGEEIKVSYQAKVVKVCNTCSATNEAVITFNYKISQIGCSKTKTVGPKAITIQICPPTFKQLDLDGLLVVPYPKPEIKIINDIKVFVDIIDYYLIKTIKGVSMENRTLTGNELIITSRLRQVVNYTANDDSDSSYSSCFDRKFSTYIVLPEEVKNASSLRIIPTVVEDVYYKKINNREVFTSVNLFLSTSMIH